MNLSGILQFCCVKMPVFELTAMQFDSKFSMGSELFVVMLVEHQVTLSQDFCFPLVQKTSGAEVKLFALKNMAE
jgi:hypothetical protein